MPGCREYSRQGEWCVGRKGNAYAGANMPVQTIFENLEAGLSIKEITEVFDVTEAEVKAVLRFATQSLERAASYG
jgi:uncharacterized protein (DUF433 family)